VLNADCLSFKENQMFTKVVLRLIPIAVLLTVSAFAVDGTLLINQATVMAGSGFPYKITQPGSYRLSGNLVVPNSNTTAIVIATDFVTLDLNGFSIIGPVDCSGSFPCPGAGNGNGVTTDDSHAFPHFNITIRNGTIQGMGNDGVFLRGDSNLVEHMNVRSNGGEGVRLFASQAFASSMARDNNAQLNGFDGIFMDTGLVAHNTADNNGFSGIFLTEGSASGNVANHNGGFGLKLRGNINYFGNSLSGNTLGAVSAISGGVNQGQNLCDGAACPGAIF
jgi:hypothetical protein